MVVDYEAALIILYEIYVLIFELIIYLIIFIYLLSCTLQTFCKNLKNKNIQDLLLNIFKLLHTYLFDFTKITIGFTGI